MKALARYGKEFGGYRMIDVPEPECGPEDIIIEVKAAAICGADMKHFKVENGSDQFNSIRGHEFAGEIVKVGTEIKDWKIGQRIVSDNSAHVCGTCPACEAGDFLCCEHKVNLGLDNNTWGGGFSKYCKIPGEILRIHKHAIWEIPEGLAYEEAALMDPICNSYKAVAQQAHLLPGQDVVVFGTGPSGLFAVQVNRSNWIICSTGCTYYGSGQHCHGRSSGRHKSSLRCCKTVGCDTLCKWIDRGCCCKMYRNLWKR